MIEDKEDASIEMFRIGSLYKEAFINTLNGYSGEEEVELKSLLIKLARAYTPYGIIQESTIDFLLEHIFTVELHRDFIWKLSINFSFYIGDDENLYSSVCKAISIGLDITSRLDINSLVPVELKKRHLDKESILECLLSNKWLVMIILLMINYRRDFNDGQPTIQKVLESRP